MRFSRWQEFERVRQLSPHVVRYRYQPQVWEAEAKRLEEYYERMGMGLKSLMDGRHKGNKSRIGRRTHLRDR